MGTAIQSLTTAPKGLTWDEHLLFQQYLKDISKYPLLTRAEERVLIQKAADGNKKAQEALVLGNLRFVINVAALYRGQGMALAELVNEGNIGLLEAARRFDPSRDIKFISYAVWWIRQAITRAIAEKCRLVRISAEKELVLRRLHRTASSMRQTIGGQYVIDTEPLTKACRYKEDQITEIMAMGQRHSSLDAPAGEDGDGASLMDRLASDEKSAEARAERKSRDALLRAAMDRLPENERKVLELHFGMDRNQESSLLTISRRMRLSKERVRQIKEQALNRLRDSEAATELVATEF